jgi:hypothetical protein
VPLRSIVLLEVRAIENLLMPLERLYDGYPSSNYKSNKQNCTNHHVFDPSEEIHRRLCSHSDQPNLDFRPPGVILRRCDIFAAR